MSHEAQRLRDYAPAKSDPHHEATRRMIFAALVWVAGYHFVRRLSLVKRQRGNLLVS